MCHPTYRSLALGNPAQTLSGDTTGPSGQTSVPAEVMRRKALAVTALAPQSGERPLAPGTTPTLVDRQALPVPPAAGGSIADGATRHMSGGGAGGPFPTNELSPADTTAASNVNTLRMNPNGTAQLRTTTGATVKIQRNGGRVTGTIADSLGSISFSGDYIDIPGKPSVQIANMRMTPSLGTLINPPGKLTITRNVNRHIVFEFDKDVSLRVLHMTRTPYKGRQAYRLNP